MEMNYDDKLEFKAISKDQLMIKKINMYGEDYYILYIKKDVKNKNKKQDNSNKVIPQILPKFTQLNDLTTL